MDDTSLQDLENELKALRPRRPSILLRARVEHELSQPESAPRAAAAQMPPRYTSATTLRSWKWFSWQMAAAAVVALTVSVGVWRWQASRNLSPVTVPSAAPTETALADAAPTSRDLTPAPGALAATDTYRPVKAANVLYDLKDEGPVMLDDNTPGWRIRARYVDTYTWKNPATNASLKWSVPRDEVRVLPASFH